MPTPMGSDNSLTVKLWAVKDLVDMYKKSAFGRMLRRGTIMVSDDLNNAKAGDEVTIGFTSILTGTGITEGGTLTGNEESLNNSAFTMKYNVVRHAVANPNEDTIEQARTTIPFYKTARGLLSQWHVSRYDASVFNQLAGCSSTTITVDGTVYSGSLRTIVQGLNAVTAPSTNRIIRAGGAATDQALTSSNKITLDLIDAAVESLTRTYPSAGTLDNDEFDLYISPEQFTDLKRDTSGKIQWYTVYLAAMQGGQIGNNPIANASPFSMEPVGKYGSVNIIVANRVAYGQNSSTSAVISNVRRAVLVGKNALAYGSKFAGAFSDMSQAKEGKFPFKYFEQLKDYEYIKGIEARSIYGVKKIVFDNEDLGVVVLSTYAAPHTS